MNKKRNYINAIVEFHDDKTQTEVIFKVGKVDLEDDMHVFGYLHSEEDIEELTKEGNKEFRVLQYWTGKRINNNDCTINIDKKSDWFKI
ncbi:MAG: hypothetical protein CML04_02070 [Pseudozobellia sp.]|nr:hypothetical protein [Pseudozobellia sp.]MBG48969.1 hypothetical protein [Pseudozobellia sp.]|tara:strand:+ start:351166 stop:351432 length:267 start_codon:yes stop_codon:yes gene_type:complete